MSSPEKLEKQQGFVSEFKDIKTEKELRDFEEANHDKLINSSEAILTNFDEKWLELTGSLYRVWTPVTAAVDKTKTDPRSNQYLMDEAFTAIQFVRTSITRRDIERFQFTVHGTVRRTGSKRHMWNNLSTYALPQRIGEEAAGKILVMSEKGARNGEVKGDFKLRVMGFWQVRFHPKSNPNDTDKVLLAWEGQTLQVERDVDNILTGFYIEAAHHALEAKYETTQTQARKLVSWVERNPLDILRPATYEEWIEWKAKGDKIYKADRKAAGYE